MVNSNGEIPAMIAMNGTLLLNTLWMVANETVIQSRYGQEELTSFNNYLLSVGEDAPREKCFGSYGCFGLKEPWTSDYRPESRFPESLHKVHPRFALYAPKNRDAAVYLDLNEVDIADAAGMNTDLPLYILIHGFTESGTKRWILAMKDKILAREPCNVIIVDWGHASNPPYPQAVANIRLVGAVAAHLIEALYEDDEAAYDRVHCIGHSLGAHVCGYIGYQLQKDFGFTLGRITGMDPAGPHFAKTEPPVRLDRTAAKYVDVVHTDIGGFTSFTFGITEGIGHVDFYPNGGRDQPGCAKTFSEFANANGLVLGVKKFVACNHVRSYEIFLDSIDRSPSCPFLSISCESYEAFRAGNCFKCGHGGHDCVTFGLHSNTSYLQQLKRPSFRRKRQRIQYFMTGDTSPFCMSHYKVTIYVSSHEESKVHGGEVGSLWFTMHATTDGSGQRSGKISLGKESYHEPGANYTYVVPGDAVRKLRAVEVEWQYTTNFINPLTWRIMSSPRIYVDMIVVRSLETEESIVVCPKDRSPLINSTPQLMLTSYCPNT